MNPRTDKMTMFEVALWWAVVLCTVLIVEFDEPIGEWVTRHWTSLGIVLVVVAVALFGWVMVRAAMAGWAPASEGLPRTWARTLMDEPRCDLCGAQNTSFYCGDHKLILCAACTNRHDARYRCNIRYVPAVHEMAGRRA